jgi:ABC-type Co2+ transport system permease subunit
MSGVNFGELVRRAIKYIIEGLVVAIAAYAIPKTGSRGSGALSTEEIVIIALVAAATFAVLDVFVPAMGSSARNGAGLGIGLNLVRFPGGF